MDKERVRMKNIAVIIGYLFVMVVSVFAATQTKAKYLTILLMVSSVISFLLAITRVYSSMKMEKRIKELEDNQISFEYDESREGLKVVKGRM